MNLKADLTLASQKPYYGEELPRSYTELLPYVIPSPDQKRAGSCLYMSSTGAMEILANKHFGHLRPEINGPYDLAELYALRGKSVFKSKSWFEDPILRFNSGGMLSKDIPFNPLTFWDDRLPAITPVQLPPVRTKTLYAAKGLTKSARLKFGLLNESHIEMIKTALVAYQAPVLIIYRDAGFTEDYGHWDTWHAVVIIGYDDEGREDSSGQSRCAFVERSFTGLPKSDQQRLRKVMQQGGGCRSQGIFYVRDSEGAASGETRVPLFDKRSYDWTKYLGNHLFVAYIPQQETPIDDFLEELPEHLQQGQQDIHRSF